MEILVGSDDARSDSRAGALNELPVGFVVEQQLRQRGHRQRINDADQDSRHDRHEHGGNEITFDIKLKSA